MQKIVEIIKAKLAIDEKSIRNIIALLQEGNTIAFIARYRKELTNNTTDEMLLEFQELYEYSQKLLKRKEEITHLLKEKEVWNASLEKLIEEAITLTTLEDIYEPFKGVKSTKANTAIENGLEGLANIIMSMKYSKEEVAQKAQTFLNENVKTIQEAIAGACDILALRYSQELKTKELIRNNIQNHALLVTKPTKTFDANGLYKEFATISSKAKYLKSYKLLALFRAVNEEQVTLKIEVDEAYLLNNFETYRIPLNANSSKAYVLEAYKDGLKRLLLPSLKREFISSLKEKASNEAIELFGKNLQELLLTPPLVNQVILGLDPGYKTGCKWAIIDQNGEYMTSGVIYLLTLAQSLEASKTILDAIKKYDITAIAIGNGTASKETAQFISQLIKENQLDVKYAVVSEIGASVYSASKIAQEEYGFLDVTIRGAISIAQRLRDPMAALVKIDPKSLGIGQYQHDVNQSDLTKKLNAVTFNLVNKVGVDLNSASYKLLSFVSGISEKLAKNIIEHRQKIKVFRQKEQLLEVKGVGAKAYEQSVGFLRIKNGVSYLDNSGIHPESYAVAAYLKEKVDLTHMTASLLDELAMKLHCGVETLKDIIKELQKPGFDMREELEQIAFCEEVKSIEELKEEDIVSGVVRNITDFGAFIDIGLKNDALLHISQASNQRIGHIMEVLSINQHLKRIRVLSVDVEKQRVSLSLKDL